MPTPRTAVLKSSISTERSPWLRETLIGVLLLVASASASAANPNTARIDDLEARMDRVDRIVSNQSLTEMSQRLDALQAEMRTQQGRIEELQNENEQLKRQQRDLYADLEKRLQAGGVVEGGSAGAAAAAGAATAETTAKAGSATPDNGESAQYKRAMDALKARNYAAATEGFRSLAATYPDGEMADNTQYWLGESYYVTQEYDHAAAAFQHVLSGWPNSRKVPDALLKLGYTQIEQKKLAAARATLQQVIDKYPDADAAKLAADRLSKLPAQ
jgi:tol-pal system protein YbgF